MYVGVGYIAVIFILGGLRPDHVYMGMLCLLDYYNRRTRLFLTYFFPFILTGVVFDSMRYFFSGEMPCSNLISDSAVTSEK